MSHCTVLDLCPTVRHLQFLDSLASLDSKLSVSQSVIDVFRLAHLRVFQSYFARYLDF